VRYASGAPLRPLVVTNIYNDPVDIMPLFRYINNTKELNYNIKVINSLSSFYYKFFEKITMQFLP
jgi:hypothetical protein